MDASDDGINRAALTRFDQHVCAKPKFWRRRKARAITIEASEANGIGRAFTACCTCGKTVNVTDYSAW